MGVITPHTTTANKTPVANDDLQATAIPVLVPNKGLHNELLIKKYLAIADAFTKAFRIALVVLVALIVLFPFLGWFGLFALLAIALSPLSWVYVAILLALGITGLVFDRKAAKLLRA